jgi:threonylcarbamoyladenosine tRNA methylthiotransferase MtaB
MAGFPGETREDFQATCDLIRESPLSYLHAFPFSARPGTDAFLMGDQIPPGTIHERVQILRALSQEKNLAFRSRLVGRSLPAITLAKEERAGSSVVLTDNYIHARVAGLQVPPNRLVTVRIAEARAESTSAVVECSAPAC